MLQGVLGLVAIGGDHHRHRLAHVIHFVPCQGPVVGSLYILRHRPARRDTDYPLLRQLLAGKCGDHTRLLQGGRDIDVRDPGVRERAAEDDHVQHARQLDVVGKVPPAR